MKDEEAGAPGEAGFALGLPVIRARKNDRLRLVRALATRRGRRRHGRFVVEGTKAIRDVLEHDPRRLEQVLFRVGDELPLKTLEAARERGVPIYPVAASLWGELADAETPQPVLAVGPIAWTPLEAVLGADQPGPRAVVACLGVQDPGNLGTILRTARFFGLAGVVVLPGTQDPWSPKVVRGTAGAVVLHPPAQAGDVASLLAAARAAELEPVALAAHGGAPLGPGALPARALLLLGAEGPGLPGEAQAARPITIAAGGGQVESLNVAVAFGVVAHAWAQDRAGRG